MSGQTGLSNFITAKGHGAYPFWWGGGSDDGDADLQVWWSEKFGAEKFYHSKCTGLSLKMRGVPCTHLMFAKDTNAGQSYLYTDSYCCKSQASSSGGGSGGPGEILYPSQGNFMDIFTYQGDVDFNGVITRAKLSTTRTSFLPPNPSLISGTSLTWMASQSNKVKEAQDRLIKGILRALVTPSGMITSRIAWTLLQLLTLSLTSQTIARPRQAPAPCRKPVWIG